MRGETVNLGPISAAAEAGPTRSRTGSAEVRPWSRRRIGLLLLAVSVLPWLPMFGPPRDATPAKRVRGIGDARILAFAFAADGATIATIQMDGRVTLRDAAGAWSRPSVLDDRGHAWALASAPDGRTLALGGREPDILQYDARTGGAGHPLGMPIRWARDLAFSPDARTLAASNSLQCEILLWDLAAGRERARLQSHESPPIALTFAPDGRSLASGSMGDRAIFVWDLATGRPRRLGVPPGGIYALAYSPDGGWLASAGHLERPVRLWDLVGGRGDRLIGSHSHARDPVAFSPDGKLLAAVGDDGLVRLWDVTTGAELRPVGDPADRLSGVAFSPDGNLLAAIGNDAHIRLWSLAEILKARTEP